MRLSSGVRALALAGCVLAPGHVMAQAAGCGDLGAKLKERSTIAGGLQPGKNGKVDPRVACTSFTKLVANGASILKWTEANKDWCQVPDNFVESVKADHAKAVTIRAKACQVAQQAVQMEKQAREGGGGGLLGGGGLTGPTRMPQGAL